MKHFLGLITVVLWSINFYGQDISISAIIKDELTNTTINGVNIIVENSDKGTTTNENGIFELIIPFLESRIIISHLGYNTINIEASKVQGTIYLTPNYQSLEEVQVTAYSTTRKLIETGGSVGVLSKNDIVRFDQTTPLQSLNSLAGINVTSTSIGRYTVKIRGGSLGVTGHNDGYKMYWNQIPLTSASGNNPLGDIDINTVGNIQVIKGPAGSLYGAGLGGVLLFEHERPAYLTSSVSVDALVGEYGTQRYTTRIQNSTENSNINLQYTRLQSNNYREASGSENNLLNFMGEFRTSEKNKLSLIGIYADRFYGIPGELTAEQVDEDPRQPSFLASLDPGLKVKSLILGAANQYSFNDKFSNTTTFKVESRDSDFLIGSAFFVAADKNASRGIAGRSVFNYEKDLLKFPYRFSFGTELNSSILQRWVFDNGFSSPVISTDEVTTQQFLGFGQFEIDLPENIFLSAGLSFNHFLFKVDELLLDPRVNYGSNVSNVSSRLSIVKLFNEKIAVYGSLSSGFTPPRNEDFLNQDGTVNRDIKAPTGVNFEVGTRGSLLSKKISYDITYYNLNSKNEIVTRLVPRPGDIDLIIRENSGSIKREGIEATLNYLIFQNALVAIKHLRIFGNYTYNNFSFDEYQTLVADELVNFSGNFVPGNFKHNSLLGLDLTTNYGFYWYNTLEIYGKMYLNNENSVTDNPYQVLTSKLGYQKSLFRNFMTNIYLGVNNGLNSEYTTIHRLNATAGNYYNPAMPRNFFGGLSIQYNL